MTNIIITLLSISLVLIPVQVFSCELTAGYDEATPFHYSNEQGKIVGTDADVLREALSMVGCELTFVELPWTRTLGGVLNGSIDIAIGSKYTEERAVFAYYTKPYKTIDHWLYTQDSQDGKYDKIDSISAFMTNGNTLGVVRGWGYPPAISTVINDEKYAKNITAVSTFEQLPQMIERNRLDGIIATPTTLESIQRKNDLIKQLSVRARYQEPLHYLFSKKTVPAELLEKFNAELKKMSQNGRVEEIFQSYINN